MKKILVAFIASAVLAVALAGCSSNSASSSAASSASASASAASSEASTSAESVSASAASSGSSLFTSEEWPQTEATAEVPVPAFSVPTTSVSTTNNNATVTWEEVPESEVAAYIEQVKAAGFTAQARENKASENYTYTAYNNEDILDSSTINIMYTSKGDLSITVRNNRIR